MQQSPIDVQHNKIGVTGAIAWVVASIFSNRKIIDLSYNCIGDKGACEIAKKLLETKNKVQRLVLTRNKIGDEGDKALSKLPISISHRHIEIPFSAEHPIMTLFFTIITGGLGLLILPFVNVDRPIEGCLHR